MWGCGATCELSIIYDMTLKCHKLTMGCQNLFVVIPVLWLCALNAPSKKNLAGIRLKWWKRRTHYTFLKYLHLSSCFSSVLVRRESTNITKLGRGADRVPSLGGKNLQLSSECKCSCTGSFPFHHHAQAARFPEPNQQRLQQPPHSRPWHPCTAGEFFQRIPIFWGGGVCLGKYSCLYKTQVQRGSFFFFLNGRSEKGAGPRSAPPWLCLSQLLGRSTSPQSH